MMFEFATADRIIFGAGAVRQVAPAARQMGRQALLVTGRIVERAAPLLAELQASGMAGPVYPVRREPTIDMVREGAGLAQAESCDIVIAFGGGSVIDAGKAIAAILGNGGDPLDYLEVIGRGRPLEHSSAPFIAVPTTAGTGSEVTRNAVLASPEHRVKASLRSAHMLPRLAVVDPELTLDLPPAITAATGLDALTQLIEPYVSVRANAMTDVFCQEGMRKAAAGLLRACHNGRDLGARSDMSWASLLGGLALANAGLGAAHGFAAPIGGMFDAPHGAVCAALLPHVMIANILALRARLPDSEALARYVAVARILTGNQQANPEDGVAWIRYLCAELRIPPLRSYGVGLEHVPLLVEKAAQASSMKANPIALTTEELTRILTASM